jgi:phosphoglycolate phosphatase-like HAD superfamily hydrolase
MLEAWNSWEEDGPQAVLWDLDGSLVNSREGVARVMVPLMEEHGLMSLPGFPDLRKAADGVCPAVFVRQAAMLEGAECDPDEIVHILEDRWLALYPEGVTIIEGARELLDSYAAQGKPQAVVTNNFSSVTCLALTQLGIRGFFRTIVGHDEDDLLPPKPDAARLLRAANDLGVDIARVRFHGDTGTDLRASIAANVGEMVGYEGIRGAEYWERKLGQISPNGTPFRRVSDYRAYLRDSALAQVG